jgi:hypothetical protein
MPDRSRRVFVADRHPLDSGQVFNMMRDGRSMSADLVDGDLARWLYDKVCDILHIESFGFFSSQSLAVIDYDAMQHLL